MFIYEILRKLLTDTDTDTDTDTELITYLSPVPLTLAGSWGRDLLFNYPNE